MTHSVKVVIAIFIDLTKFPRQQKMTLKIFSKRQAIFLLESMYEPKSIQRKIKMSELKPINNVN